MFDTVLTAIGRRADTAGNFIYLFIYFIVSLYILNACAALNLEAMGVAINPSNGKIIATNEQSSVPHIYAIGKVTYDYI